MVIDRLFLLHVVIAIEEQWFAESNIGPPIRCERTCRIDGQLFAAADEDAAYRTATEWVENEAFTDANHDGSGDLTRMFALGIHQLENLDRVSELGEGVREPYGVGLYGFYLGDVDENGVPLVRTKEELEVFRTRQFHQGPPRA